MSSEEFQKGLKGLIKRHGIAAKVIRVDFDETIIRRHDIDSFYRTDDLVEAIEILEGGVGDRVLSTDMFYRGIAQAFLREF